MPMSAATPMGHTAPAADWEFGTGGSELVGRTNGGVRIGSSSGAGSGSGSNASTGAGLNSGSGSDSGSGSIATNAGPSASLRAGSSAMAASAIATPDLKVGPTSAIGVASV